MRDLHVGRWQAIALPAHQAEAGQLGSLLASFVQPLHAETDAEQRASFAHAREDGFDPLRPERLRRAEVPDPRNDDRAGIREIARPLGREERRPQRGERFAYRRQVAGLVVDQGDHSRPFVLGSIFASRLSFATATRSARANALKTASTW